MLKRRYPGSLLPLDGIVRFAVLHARHKPVIRPFVQLVVCSVVYRSTSELVMGTSCVQEVLEGRQGSQSQNIPCIEARTVRIHRLFELPNITAL